VASIVHWLTHLLLKPAYPLLEVTKIYWKCSLLLSSTPVCQLHTCSNCNSLSDGGEWGATTQEDYDTCCVGHYIAPGTEPPLTARTPADLFCRGIKHVTIVFPVLQEEKFSDTWDHSFANQARAQDVMEILNATYVPEARNKWSCLTKSKSKCMLSSNRKTL
jgi:hypothetical protein